MKGPDATPLATFDFGTAVPNGFTFTPDGRVLYGSSYFTGVSNIFRYDLETKKVDAVTNAETGFFRPIPLADGGLIVFRYSGEGFVPTRIQPRPLEDVSAITFLGERLAEEHPIVKSWMVGSPADIPFDTMPQQTGKYRLAGGLKRESFYPVFQGYKDTGAVGMRFNFSDPLQFNRASLVAAYSPAGDLPQSERLHLKADYDRFDWRGRFEFNAADFYDFFGPTKAGRKGYVFQVGKKQTLIFDLPHRLELDMSVRVAGNLDRLPEFQNVAIDVKRLLTVDARLADQDLRSSLGHVDDETGRRWSVAAQSNQTGGSIVPRFHGTFDRSVAVPAGHSSIWVRTAAGFLHETAIIRSRNSTSEHSVTTGSTIATKSAIARSTVFRGRRSTRLPAARSSNPWSSGTCRRCGSVVWGSLVSTRRGCGRRSLSEASRRTSMRARCAAS